MTTKQELVEKANAAWRKAYVDWQEADVARVKANAMPDEAEKGDA